MPVFGGRGEVMQKFSVEQITPGMRLAYDIYSIDGQLLLRKGTIIDQKYLGSLTKQGIDYVYIMSASSTGSLAKRQLGDIYEESLTTVKTFMTGAKLGEPLNRAEITETVDVLVEHVFEDINIFGQLMLMKDKDDYLFTHSVNVSLLTILISRWLKCSEQVTRQAGLAGLLHDIGKVCVLEEILNKPGRLTDEEFEEMKKHPVLGYNMIAQYDWLEPEVKSAVLMHHERIDGSGYPLGVRGDGVTLLGRMVAVADVYDAITSTRVYSARETPFKAAEVLREESFGKLDARMVKVFYDRAANFYIGQRVRLSNGEEGSVVYIDRSLPTRPVVKVGERFYDLAQERSLTIESILD
jgi:putative nucleotidyltransferase with HDIG domain